MKNIVLPIDFSEVSPLAVKQAGELAKAMGSHLWLIHVADPEPDFVGYDAGPAVVRQQVAEQMRDEHRDLQGLADELRGEGVEVTPLAVQGPTVASIVSEIENRNADLVVMGSHGHGAVYRKLMGSVCEGVLHAAKCPVLIVPRVKE
jgi:nucleotide-binding universal stress UspA family protein